MGCAALAAQRMTSLWRVAHGPRVAVRNEPSSAAKMVGAVNQDVIVRGTVVGGGEWLMLEDPYAGCFMLIEGSRVGLGTLLKPVAATGEPPQPPSPEPKAMVPPTPAQQQAPALPAASPKMSAVGPPCFWQVRHTARVMVRSTPNSNGRVVDSRSVNEVVLARPLDCGWVELSFGAEYPREDFKADSLNACHLSCSARPHCSSSKDAHSTPAAGSGRTGYMLIDGAGLGFGKLLERLDDGNACSATLLQAPVISGTHALALTVDLESLMRALPAACERVEVRLRRLEYEDGSSDSGRGSDGKKHSKEGGGGGSDGGGSDGGGSDGDGSDGCGTSTSTIGVYSRLRTTPVLVRGLHPEERVLLCARAVDSAGILVGVSAWVESRTTAMPMGDCVVSRAPTPTRPHAHAHVRPKHPGCARDVHAEQDTSS